MPSRSSLILRAGAVGVDYTQTKYANDSLLEQAVIYGEKAVTTSTTATTKAPTAGAVAGVSGGANV